MNKTQLDKTLGTIKNYVDKTTMNHFELTTATDFNTLKTTGIYSIKASGNVDTHHVPTTNHGTLIVDFSVGTPFQLWLPDQTNTVYKRTYTISSSTWGAWTNTYTGNVTGSSGSCTGNAATATKLQTARNIALTGDVTGNANFDGSGNISITTAVGDDTHEHNHLKSRGNVTAESGTTYPTTTGLSMTQAYNNSYPIPYGNVMTMYGSGVSQLLIGWSGTSGSHEKAYIRSKRDTSDAAYSGWAQIYTSAHPQPSVTGSSGSCTGNAATATKLATARTINGTSFDGNANITTANWGTARTLTIGNKSQSVNGSGNVTWSLADIGAAASNSGVQKWDCTIKCATWSRIMLIPSNDVTGNAGILTVKGTRGNVVFNVTFIINCSHASKCTITQINNTEYSNFKIRAVTDVNGKSYIEIYDNAVGATNATTQVLNLSYLDLYANGGDITKYTSFTDGTTIPSGYTALTALTTVSGSYYSGTAKYATQLGAARTISLTGDVTGSASFDGSANASITTTVANDSHTHSTYLPLAGGTMTGKVGLTTAATSTDASQPTQLAYGLLSSYSNLKIIGNSDDSAGANNEYVHIATAWGLSPAVDKGIVVYGTYANCFGKKISTEGHTHSYLPLTGGTLTGSIEMGANNITFTHTDTGDIVFNEGTTQVARLWQSTSGLLLAAGSNTSPTGAGVLNIPRNSNAITIGGNKIYHAGNKPTLSELGAAAANHGNHVPLNCGSVSNWNDALYNGWYMAAGAANQPAGDSNTWFMGYVLCHNTDYVIQTLYQFTAGGVNAAGIPIYMRKKQTGNWGGWTSNYCINITGSAMGLQYSNNTPVSTGSSTQPVYFSNGLPIAGKSYFAKSTVGDIGWEREDSHAPVTVSAIAYWNGAYMGSRSNLAYCNQGAFGNIVTKNQGDYAPASHNHTVLTGEVKINNANGSFTDAWNGQGCALKVGGHMAIGGTTMSSGEYRSYSANAFRAVQGDYGFFIRE